MCKSLCIRFVQEFCVQSCVCKSCVRNSCVCKNCVCKNCECWSFVSRRCAGVICAELRVKELCVQV